MLLDRVFVRNRIASVFAFCFGILFIAGDLSADPGSQSLSRREVAAQLGSLFSSSVFGKSPVGVWVESLDHGEVLYRRNEDRPFVPASNLKVMTTAAALSMLGGEFTYRTYLFRTGVIRGDRLHGHLVIRGSGDPTISDRFTDGDKTEVFETWAAIIKRLGIKTIDGDVIGDDDAFTDQAIPDGWKDDYLSLSYAAQSSGLSFNEGCIDLIVQPGKTVGSRAGVSVAPPTNYVAVEARVSTAPSSEKKPIIRFSRDLGTNSIKASGTVPHKSSGFRGSVTVENPTLFAATVFKETLEKQGIDVTGTARDIDELADTGFLRSSPVPLASHVSPSLAEILPVVNKGSHNFYANQLFLTLGERAFGTGSWVHSASAVTSFLNSIGIDPEGLHMADGCGLSPLDSVTPEQLGRVLRFMWEHPDCRVFIDSLAVMGTDGTLRSRLKHTPAQKRVFAKTGYIKGVRALSGYVRTLEGEYVAFCFLLNNAEPVSGVFRQRVDQALLALVRMK